MTPPLSEKDQDDRVRMALGLTHDDPLPEVTYENLLAYHRYLSKSLVFPFKARYEKPVGRSKRVEMPLTVTGLLRPDECEIDEQYGIIGTGSDPGRTGRFPAGRDRGQGVKPKLRNGQRTTPTGSITGGEFDSNPARVGTVPLLKRGW